MRKLLLVDKMAALRQVVRKVKNRRSFEIPNLLLESVRQALLF